MHKVFRRALGIILLLGLLLSNTGCFSETPTIPVTWVDADGNIIASETVAEGFDPSTRPLPEDDANWHYTGWQRTQSGDVLVYTAVRVAKQNFVWKDYDGTILKETYITKGEEIPTFDLPEGSEKWQYTQWNQVESETGYVYEAERVPNEAYFVGNVFQIIIKDSEGQAMGSGSGFILNDEGWFITNNHVMSNGYSAVAFFDIKDTAEGQPYTQLNVLGGLYHNEDKDIFIGKLQNYEKIRQYYKDITFTEEYTEGEVSYSIGYPNSSIKLQINAGVILEEYSDIYDKIDGVYYVLSDSYIAPGSSGGILVNENFEVIGITTIGYYSDTNKTNYTSGGSVPYFLFQNVLATLTDSNIQPIHEIYDVANII